MKKTFFFAISLLASALLLTNFTSDSVSSFIMTVVTEEPNLPDTPFDYERINFPDHLSAEQDTIETGYTGRIDTIRLQSITDDLATLGRVLFYDQKLSALENISCGSCHDQSLSFTENKSFSEGLVSRTKRNSMHLNDLGWTNDDSFSWDMRVTDLHEMIKLPLTDENEIGANMLEIGEKLASTNYYEDLFTLAYGDPEITEDRIVNALVQFIKSMTTFESKFDQGSDNNFENFTQQELEGKDLFGMTCGLCHIQGGIEFGIDDIQLFELIPELFNNGLGIDPNDLGVGEWHEDDFYNGIFKIPTLKNIEVTAPYMHDGRFTTLDEVIDHYSTGIDPNSGAIFLPFDGFQFSDNDKAALKAFLVTLTDQNFITNPKWSDPFELSKVKDKEIENLVLRPNPMLESAIIEFSNPHNHLVSINVLSSQGKFLRHDQTTSTFYEMRKEDFLPGIYYVEMIMGDARSVQKLIVQ